MHAVCNQNLLYKDLLVLNKTYFDSVYILFLTFDLIIYSLSLTQAWARLCEIYDQFANRTLELKLIFLKPFFETWLMKCVPALFNLWYFILLKTTLWYTLLVLFETLVTNAAFIVFLLQLRVEVFFEYNFICFFT